MLRYKKANLGDLESPIWSKWEEVAQLDASDPHKAILQYLAPFNIHHFCISFDDDNCFYTAFQLSERGKERMDGCYDDAIRAVMATYKDIDRYPMWQIQVYTNYGDWHFSAGVMQGFDLPNHALLHS